MDAIEKVEPSSQRALITKQLLQQDLEQRKLLMEYVQKLMVDGVDYGKIPGTDKPTLLKPGAEKLVDLFRCTPKFALVKEAEDFERGFFNYMFRCRLVNRETGAVLAEGFGSANSREGRYRWRNSNRKCPACGKETIIQGKAEYGGGWLCFKKKGGCGAKYNAGDASIEGQKVGQVENEDIATLANTILKMAKKRALVDGAIALARCSDMFTQDVEDLGHEPDAPPPPLPSPLMREASQEDLRQAYAQAEVEQKALAEELTFRDWKGRKPKDMTADELTEARHVMSQTLKEHPRARSAPRLQMELAAVSAELDARARELRPDEPADGLPF